MGAGVGSGNGPGLGPGTGGGSGGGVYRPGGSVSTRRASSNKLSPPYMNEALPQMMQGTLS